MRAPRIIDSHVHVWPADRKPPYPAGEGHVEALIRHMDQHGVFGAVAIQPSWLHDDHAYLRDVLDEYGDRLWGVGVIPLGTPGDEDEISQNLTRLEDLAASRGICGVRINAMGHKEAGWLEGHGTFLSHCEALGLSVNIHAAPEQLEEIGRVAANHPGLLIAVDHLGRPDPGDGLHGERFQALLALARHPNVYVKVSALPHFAKEPHPYPDLMPLVHEVWRRFTPERTMWGSDSPVVLQHGPYEQALTPILLDETLTEGERAQVLGRSVRTFYGI